MAKALNAEWSPDRFNGEFQEGHNALLTAANKSFPEHRLMWGLAGYGFRSVAVGMESVFVITGRCGR